MKQFRLLYPTVALSALFTMTVCGSRWPDITYPEKAAASAALDISATDVHPPDSLFIGGDFVGLVFGVVLPSNWTAAAATI
jgi:hypothetical protein